MADFIQEIADHVSAVFRMIDLGMELNAVESPRRISDPDIRAGC
jgi:hypothetical protein